MKNFNGWEKLNTKNLDVIANYILTNKTAKEFQPDVWLYKLFPDNITSVLDFGCGIGRNSFGIYYYSNKLNVIGYDHSNMISKTDEYHVERYDSLFKPDKRLKFIDDWEIVKNDKFDCILCSLVLQHIYEKDLKEYLNDFKTMSNHLIVTGRRFNDDMINGEYKNTWQILENNGFHPTWCSKELNGNEYQIDGDMNEHFTCVYQW